jgi:hypothetical protein
MRKFVFIIPLFLLTAGCRPSGMSESDYLKSARAQVDFRRAGYVAAVGSLAGAKVETDKAEEIKVIVDKLKETIKSWNKGGFKALLPKVKEELVDKLLDGDERKAHRLIALKLAEALLDELDAKFEREPEWKENAEAVGLLLARFFEGASDGLKAYIEQ